MKMNKFYKIIEKTPKHVIEDWVKDNLILYDKKPKHTDVYRLKNGDINIIVGYGKTKEVLLSFATHTPTASEYGFADLKVYVDKFERFLTILDRSTKINNV
jgi:4-hydroxyphenylpyruvate dioxygenase-like putative hemolysin